MNTVLFKIDGMRCEACASRIQTQLGASDGVREARVGFDASEARVRYDPALTSEDGLVDAITRPGYRVAARAPG